MKQVLLQPAFVLHRRPYRESSFLVELLTKEYGRVGAIARGVRKARSTQQGLLQPFIPLLVSWTGKGELMTLTQIEVHGKVMRLQGECLFAGFYLNELLLALLQKWDAHPALFTIYEKTLSGLEENQLEQKVLRLFEKRLLEELGYGLLPKSDISLHNTFSPDKYYRFVPEHGFVVSELGQPSSGSYVFSGKSLLAVAREDWQDEEALQVAKRLTRLVLAPLLGPRTLYSRQLFLQPQEWSKDE